MSPEFATFLEQFTPSRARVEGTGGSGAGFGFCLRGVTPRARRNRPLPRRWVPLSTKARQRLPVDDLTR
jgi:hypothetical protein